MTTTDAQEATATHYCKFPGCTNEAPSRVGRYSYCEQHRGKLTPTARPTVAEGSHVAALSRLTKLAKAADKARAKATAAAKAAADARTDAEQAERIYRAAVRDAVAES